MTAFKNWQTEARQVHFTSRPGARRPLGSSWRPQAPFPNSRAFSPDPRPSASPARPAACTWSRTPEDTALWRPEGRESGAESSTGRARSSTPRGRLTAVHPCRPRWLGSPRDRPHSRLGLRRAAHPPPLGNIRLGRGGHECACAPRPLKHRPRQATVRGEPSFGRARDLASVNEGAVLRALCPDRSHPLERRKLSN